MLTGRSGLSLPFSDKNFRNMKSLPFLCFARRNKVFWSIISRKFLNFSASSQFAFSPDASTHVAHAYWLEIEFTIHDSMIEKNIFTLVWKFFHPFRKLNNKKHVKLHNESFPSLCIIAGFATRGCQLPTKRAYSFAWIYNSWDYWVKEFQTINLFSSKNMRNRTKKFFLNYRSPKKVNNDVGVLCGLGFELHKKIFYK